MARTGYKITVYLDDNPNSSGYMETYEERVLDENTCPISEDDLVLVSSECEVVFSGKTGYRINIYYNRTTGEYQQTREPDPECESSSDEEIWVPSGSPFCETTEQGVNTGYMVQLVVQMNQLLPNYGETKYNKWKTPECGANNCAIWDDLQQQCHISVINCVATFDGTADVTQIDINPLSATYNQTRTVNKQSNDCENCTQTTFSWQLVGDMCGDDELLCSNGLQQVSTNSYTVHRKYKTIGNSTPVPMDEYQIVLKTEDDEDCGYIRPQYEMRRMPGEYICDFETYTKYEKYSQYVSYDSGVTWSLVSPEVSQRGDVIAYDSYDCGKPMYRWVFNGEYMCEDNGDDGKVRYYNSFSDGEFSDLVSSVPCNESGVLSGSEVTSVQQTIYRRVGDCVSVVSGTNITRNNSSSKIVVWLGDYTEEIGDITNYASVALDIPERVKKLTRINRTDYFENIVMMPQYPVSATSVFQNGGNGHCAIWVAADVYEAWHDDEYWGRFSGSSTTAKLLPMNNDSVAWKAKVEMKSDFNEWAYFIPDGEDSTTITSEEGKYGRAIMSKITLSDKIRTISRDSFGNRNSGYREARKLNEIDLGHGIETIGSSAFSYNFFTSVHIPDSVRTIERYAFANYYETNYSIMSSITFDEGVETIGNYAFSGNNCSTITFPDSVKTIGDYAFYNSYKRLSRLEIGSGCTSIGSYVIKGVDTLVVKALTPPTVRSDSFGANPPGEILVPCASLSLYREQWSDWADIILSYEPCDDTYRIYATNSEGDVLRRPCIRTGTTLSSGDTSLLSDMVSAVVGSCVTEIGNYTFAYLSNLTSVSMPDTVETFAEGAFRGINLSTLQLPIGLTTIGDDVFRDTHIDNLIVPNLSSITFAYETKPFNHLSVTNETIDMEIINSYNVPTNVVNLTISDRAREIVFDSNSIRRLNSSVDGYFNIPSSVSSITLMSSAVTHCVFESDSQLKTIGYNCFYGNSNLVYVNVPSGVTDIGGQAFYNCSGLTSLDLPAGLISIGQNTFNGCTSMQSLTVRAVVPPSVGYSNTFDNMGGYVYVPAGSLDVYKTANGWRWISDRILPIS